MIYGYARVSSDGQDRYGTGLETQEKMLRDAGAQEILYESYTGTKKDRPKLNELMDKIQTGDEVVMTKLDRMARSVHDGIEIIEEFMQRGVSLNILNMMKFDGSPTSTLMYNVLLSFAQFERDMIADRTSSGKAAKRASDPNWREGRKRLEIYGFEDYLQKHKSGLMTVAQCCKELNISRSTWNRRIRELA